MSIQYMVLGSNPRPSEHESPTITTRPGSTVPRSQLILKILFCEQLVFADKISLLELTMEKYSLSKVRAHEHSNPQYKSLDWE